MGVDRSSGDLRGLLVPDPRVSIDTLVSKTHGTVPSAYTQAAPRPGVPAPDQDTALALRASGAQSADGDLEIRTERSGAASIESAGYVWRDVAAGDTDYMGADPPAVVTGWQPLLHTTVTDGASHTPDVIRLLSGRLLACIGVTPVGLVRVRRYDPETSAWTNVDCSPTGAGTGYVTAAATLVQLPSGRVLLYVVANDEQQIDVYYSDDDGDAWAPGGYRVVDLGVEEAAVIDLRAAYSAGEILLLAHWTDSVAGKTLTQWASADDGTVFSTVLASLTDSTSEIVESVDVIGLSSGGFVVLYTESAATPDNLVQRRIGSAFTSLDSVSSEEPDAFISPAGDSVTGWQAEDGLLWLVVEDESTGFGGMSGSMYRSLDRAVTWEKMATYGSHHLHSSVPPVFTTRLRRYSGSSIGGRVVLVSRWQASASTYAEKSVAAVWYAGWSTHTCPSGDGLSREDFRDSDYITWGGVGGEAGGLYLPIELPGALNWTAAGAGSEAITADGELEITTTAGQARDYARTASDDTTTAVLVEIEVEIDSGDGSTSAEEITLTILFGGTGVDIEVQLRLAAAGYRVYDVNAAANAAAAVTYDLTTAARIRIALDDDGNLRTWHTRPGHTRAWIEGSTVTGLQDDGSGLSGANVITWGHTGAAANVSRWTQVSYCFWIGRWSGSATTSIAAGWSNPASLHSSSYSTSGPELITDGVAVQAIGGPTWYGETQRIQADYDYPISAIHPGSSPSPARGWRSSADNSAIALVWDLEADPALSDSMFESSTLGVFLVDSNIQSAKLQGWSGSTWVDIVSLDASHGYASLPVRRVGRIVSPDTGGGAPSGDRWSPHMAHAGDTLRLSGDPGTLHIIAANSEGGWRSGSKLSRLRLDPETMSGSEPSSATGTIYRRNFGSIVHEYAGTYRYIRLSVGAHKTAEGYYRIGAIAIGPVYVYGLQYGDGWAQERAANVEVSEMRSGARATRLLGPVRRAVDISWSEQAQDTTRMWDSEPSPDYLTGSSAGEPVASLADTAYQVLGLLDRTDGPHRPVVHLGRIERGTGSKHYYADQTWLYGRLVGPVASIDHVVGADGTQEVVRGNRIRIEEEV